MHHNTISNHVQTRGVQHTAGQEMEGVLVPISFDGMTCVGAAVESSADIVGSCQDVYQLALAFITPLGA